MDLSFIEKRINHLNDLVGANADAHHPTSNKVEMLLNDLEEDVLSLSHSRPLLSDLDRALLLITTSNMVAQLGYITNAMEAHNFVLLRNHELPLYTGTLIKQVEQICIKLREAGKPQGVHF